MLVGGVSCSGEGVRAGGVVGRRARSGLVVRRRSGGGVAVVGEVQLLLPLWRRVGAWGGRAQWGSGLEGGVAVSMGAGVVVVARWLLLVFDERIGLGSSSRRGICRRVSHHSFIITHI